MHACWVLMLQTKKGFDMDGAGWAISPFSWGSKGPRATNASPVFLVPWELCSFGLWFASNTVRNLQNNPKADTIHILPSLSTNTFTHPWTGNEKFLALLSWISDEDFNCSEDLNITSQFYLLRTWLQVSLLKYH